MNNERIRARRRHRRLRNVNRVLGVIALGLLGSVVLDLLPFGPRANNEVAPAVTLAAAEPGDAVVFAEDDVLSAVPERRLPCAASRIMLLGDSTTSDVDSFRGPLYRSLINRSIPVDFVGSQRSDPTGGGDPSHEGHPAYGIGPDTRVDPAGDPVNLYDNVETWITRASPNIVVISVGGSDFSPGATDGALAPQRLVRLVERIVAARSSLIVVINDAPPTNEFPRTSANEAALNDAARRLGNAAEDDMIWYTNSNSRLETFGFDPAIDLQKNRVETTVAGGRKMAAAIEGTVARAIVADRRLRCTEEATPDASSGSDQVAATQP
jgi:hypothetical protein